MSQLKMPGARRRRARPPRRDRRGAARDRAGRGRDRGRARDAALRVRRAHRLPAAADGGGAAGDHRAGRRACCAIATTNGIKVVPRGAGTSLSGGALPLADGVLLGMGKFNRIREIDFENRVVVAEPGVTNLGDHQGGRGRRLLLRARPVLADRLHHRRQRRGEFRRRALPEIRADHQQRARLRAGADHRRDRAHRRQASRRRRLRPARHHHRLGGPARRRHRGDGAHPAQAGDRARRAGRLRDLGGRRRLRRAASSAPASSRAAWR